MNAGEAGWEWNWRAGVTTVLLDEMAEQALGGEWKEGGGG